MSSGLQLYTINDVAKRFHKSRRWLQEFLKVHPHYRLAGRTKLFTEEDIAKLHDALGRPWRVRHADPAGKLLSEIGRDSLQLTGRGILRRVYRARSRLPQRPRLVRHYTLRRTGDQKIKYVRYKVRVFIP